MAFGPPSRACDCLAVNDKGNDRSNRFRDPNAFQTPTAPKNLLSKNAAGMMTTTYRQREISKEGVPFPSPSNAPEDVTETAETINPAPMMRKAVSPA
mgnify:FL=1